MAEGEMEDASIDEFARVVYNCLLLPELGLSPVGPEPVSAVQFNAAQVTRMVYRLMEDVFADRLREDYPLFVVSLKRFLTYTAVYGFTLFDHYGKKVYLTVTLLTAFILRMASFCAERNMPTFIQYVEITWTEIFRSRFKRPFIHAGSWCIFQLWLERVLKEYRVDALKKVLYDTERGFDQKLTSALASKNFFSTVDLVMDYGQQLSSRNFPTANLPPQQLCRNLAEAVRIESERFATAQATGEVLPSPKATVEVLPSPGAVEVLPYLQADGEATVLEGKKVDLAESAWGALGISQTADPSIASKARRQTGAISKVPQKSSDQIPGEKPTKLVEGGSLQPSPRRRKGSSRARRRSEAELDELAAEVMTIQVANILQQFEKEQIKARRLLSVTGPDTEPDAPEDFVVSFTNPLADLSMPPRPTEESPEGESSTPSTPRRRTPKHEKKPPQKMQ